MNEWLNILIGGDIVPTDTNIQSFCNGSMDDIVSADLMDLLQKADMRIFNLETPLCDELSPINKEGPCFRAPTKCINGLLELRPTVFTLANNHILDQGQKGLKSTIKALDESHIQYIGVGSNTADANHVLFYVQNGITVGVYGCVEHEYTVATPSQMGANPFDPYDSIAAIKEARDKCDCLIVLYHGGKEYYEYPSPELQRRCHKMIDAGASLVICQHSHCVGTAEDYKNGHILYGQGNFILDKYVKAYEEFFQTGLLVKVKINYITKEYVWELVPIKKIYNGVRMANETENKEILQQIHNRSMRIREPDFVYKSFTEYTKKNCFRYILRFSRFGYIISSIDNRFFGGKLLNHDLLFLLGKHQRMAIENCLQCETHNEMVRYYMKR